MRRKLLWVLAIAITHAAITMTLLFITGGLVMSAFDGNRASSSVDSIGIATIQFLMAPLGLIYQHIIPREWSQAMPALGNLFFYANSLLWGIVIASIIHRRMTTRSASIPAVSVRNTD